MTPAQGVEDVEPGIVNPGGPPYHPLTRRRVGTLNKKKKGIKPLKKWDSHTIWSKTSLTKGCPLENLKMPLLRALLPEMMILLNDSSVGIELTEIASLSKYNPPYL